MPSMPPHDRSEDIRPRNEERLKLRDDAVVWRSQEGEELGDNSSF